MTLTEALAASPTGIAVRHHNKEFMQAAIKGHRAFFYNGTAMAPASWPKESDDWMILKAGPTSERLKAGINR